MRTSYAIYVVQLDLINCEADMCAIFPLVLTLAQPEKPLLQPKEQLIRAIQVPSSSRHPLKLIYVLLISVISLPPLQDFTNLLAPHLHSQWPRVLDPALGRYSAVDARSI